MKSILGIGNALTDILAVLPDDTLLKTYHLPKGSMQHVDMETGDKIWAALKPLGVKYVAGGSAANTITCTAIFGMPSSFIGKIGDDELGLLFKSDQEQYGVHTHLLKSEHSSGRSMVFVSGGNAERTFAVYLGLYLMASLTSIVDSAVLRTVLSWISVFSRYQHFALGLFALDDIVYYISLTVVFLFLTDRVLEKKRWA